MQMRQQILKFYLIPHNTHFNFVAVCNLKVIHGRTHHNVTQYKIYKTCGCCIKS